MSKKKKGNGLKQTVIFLDVDGNICYNKNI